MSYFKFKTLDEHDEPILSLANLTDGYFASCSENYIRKWETTYFGKSGKIKDKDIDFSCILFHNNVLISGSDDNVQIWQPDKLECIQTDTSLMNVVAMCGLPNGNLAVANDDKNIIILNPNFEEIEEIENHHSIKGLDKLNTGHLICASREKLKVFDKSSFKKIKTVELINSISNLKVLKNGNIAIGTDSEIQILEPTDFRCIGKLPTGGLKIKCIESLLDNQIIAGLSSGSSDACVQVWDGINYKIKETWKESNPVTSLLVLPDQKIVSGQKSGNITIWSK